MRPSQTHRGADPDYSIGLPPFQEGGHTMTTENWKKRIIAILDQLDEKDLRTIWFFVRRFGKEG